MNKETNTGYIAGATSETERLSAKIERLLLYVHGVRMQERNKAIDECIALLFQEDGDFQHSKSPAMVLKELEALKKILD